MTTSLPDIQSAIESADFGRTVSPFLSQLVTIPTRIFEAGLDANNLKEVYLTTNPFVTTIAFALFLSCVFLVVSEVNRNYSQVDRCWGLIPCVCNVHFAIWVRMAGLPTSTVDSIAFFSVFWGARLTFNYWRRGGFQIGSEDYRWQIVRSRMGNDRIRFHLLNVLFISFGQSLLLCLLTSPTYVFIVLSRLPEGAVFGIPDLVFSRLLIFFVFIELFADEQQWRFQGAKRAYLDTARVPDRFKDRFTPEDLDRGFVISGLWSLCRHPNFAAEQSIWLNLYLWACYRTHTYFHWSGIGALALCLLFQASTSLTESISAAKYPEYEEYQARVGRFIPRLSLEPRRYRRNTASQTAEKGKQE